MSAMICRLCLNDSKLIDVFDTRLTNCEQLRKCILLGTGVEICRDDLVTKYICHLCSEIAIFLYKYRRNAIANDKALKQFANQRYLQPVSHTKDIVRFNGQLLHDLRTQESLNESKHDIKISEKSKKPPQTNSAVHPTIIQLIKTNPRLKVPNELLKYDIQPKILLDKNEVDSWHAPPPKRSASVANKPVSDMELFKLKFPGINIKKITQGNENIVGNTDGSVENVRKRKMSDSPSIDSISESLSPSILKRKKFIERISSSPGGVKIKERVVNRRHSKSPENKTTIDHKLKIVDYKVKISSSPTLSGSDVQLSDSKVKLSEQKVNIIEPKVKISEPKVKLPNSIKTKESSDTKVKAKRRCRSSEVESLKMNKPISKLKIQLRKSSEEPVANVIPSTENRVVGKLKIQLRSPTEEPTIKEIPPSPVLYKALSSKVYNESQVVSPIITTKCPSLAPLSSPESIFVNKKPDSQSLESDTEKIIPKKLHKSKLFESDTEFSDDDSIGAGDMPLDDTLLDDEPIVDAPTDNALLDVAPVGDPPLDETLLDTVDEELAFHCVHCNKMFSSSFQLKCHERAHKNCTICKAVFRSEDALRLHHVDVCFKTVIANLPDVQVTRVEEQPDVMKQYSKAFDRKEEETKSNDVLCISDDEDDDVVLIEDFTIDVDTDVTKNPEFRHVSDVFQKYVDVKFPTTTKTRGTDTKPQMQVKYNSKGQIVLENMLAELKCYRVPVELAAKSTTFAYISFTKAPPIHNKEYSWDKEPVITLSKKSLLAASLKATKNPPTNPTVMPITNETPVIIVTSLPQENVTQQTKPNITTSAPSISTVKPVDVTSNSVPIPSTSVNDDKSTTPPSTFVNDDKNATTTSQNSADTTTLPIENEIINLIDDAVPSTSAAQQPTKDCNTVSLRVKTPWELNNI